MKINKIFPIFNLTALVLSCTFFSACRSNVPTDEHADDEVMENEVSITTAQFKTTGIELGSVEPRNLNLVIKANGYTAVPPQNSATISTLIGGTIKDIFVLEGTYVKQGKTLATLQNLEVIEMQEDYNAAIANIEYLQLEFDRQKTLSSENVNPIKTLQEVKSKLAVEKARAQSAKSKLNVLNVATTGSGLVPIVSPISGYVGKIKIAKGAFAETGTILFEVIDNSQMHLDLNVYEKDLGAIAVNQEVDFMLTNQSNKSIKGKIFSINKSFSNESKTVAVHAKIESTDAKELISGMYVSANISVKNVTVPAVPKDAVVRNGDKFYVFVNEENKTQDTKVTKEKGQEGHGHGAHDDEMHFVAMEVIPGTTDMGYTEVNFVNTLPTNAKIVVKGSFYLISAMKGGGSHEH